jgi:hypothetical protein
MFFAVVYFLLRLVLRLAPEGENRDREAEIPGVASPTEGSLPKGRPPEVAPSRSDTSRGFLPAAAAGARERLLGHARDAASLAPRSRQAKVDL